jgi:hypothetical protein
MIAHDAGEISVSLALIGAPPPKGGIRMQWFDEEQDRKIEWCWVAPFDDVLAEAIANWVDSL